MALIDLCTFMINNIYKEWKDIYPPNTVPKGIEYPSVTEHYYSI